MGGHGRIMAAPERKEVDAEKGEWMEARGSGVVLGWAGCARALHGGGLDSSMPHQFAFSLRENQCVN